MIRHENFSVILVSVCLLVSFEIWLYIKAIIIVFFLFFGRCIECVKASPYLELANELEITKAVTYLKEKDLAKVRILSNQCSMGTRWIRDGRNSQ